MGKLSIGLRKIWQQNNSFVRRQRGEFWFLPLSLSVFCYLLMPLSASSARFMSGAVFADPVAAQLGAELYSHLEYYILLLLPPVFCLFYFLIMLIGGSVREKAKLLKPSDLSDSQERRRQYLRQYDHYIRQKEGRWKKHTFFYLLLAVEIALAGQGLFFSYRATETALLYQDYRLLTTGAPLVYTGQVHYTDRPLHNHFSYVMNPDPRYYYFSSDIGTLRCPVTNLVDTELLQPSYYVEYLPATYTVVSITNHEGAVLTGAASDNLSTLFEVPGGAWLYGDLIVHGYTEVYGYDWLNSKEQKTFDLMYGEYFSQAVLSGQEATHSIALPEPLSDNEYARVLSLYEAATYRYSRPPMRYATNDKGTIEKIYVGRISNSDVNRDEQFFIAREKAAEVVSSMPADLSDTEKCRYLARYLLEKVTYQKISEEAMWDFTDSNGVAMTVMLGDPESSTAYGVLAEGKADDKGYASAFAALAFAAEITCIPVYGQSSSGEHVWNMVRVDGRWYHIDTTDERYWLVSDRQIATVYQPISYGSCTFVPLPKAE